MLTLVKLGGSLITDKRVEQSFHADVAERIAHEIATALRSTPQPIIIGHGSGSFGHFAAHRHGTIDGVSSPGQWRGFAEVAMVAADLNTLMARVLWAAGVPVWRIQPSASMLARDGIPQEMSLNAVKTGLTSGLVPLVYGDVGLDEVRGGTIISTESLFTFFASALPVTRILLVGEVPGVLDSTGHVIPRITPSTFSEARSSISGSRGTDVTGGMLTKVSDMLALVEANPSLTIEIIDGTMPDLLRDALSATTSRVGTTICAD
ncbi:MAG: uridylate kinase [Anaerolineae bacterium]|nr:uridylate kinase [Anaerolineae bacterium]